MAGQFDVSRSADVGKSGVIGGLVSGALGGLVADLHAGGLTFGAGALIGGILGALGASGAAQAYNLARGGESGSVGWSAAFLTQRFTAALLRYLAVAHFGRGRGEWVEGEYPRALAAAGRGGDRPARARARGGLGPRRAGCGAQRDRAGLAADRDCSRARVLLRLYPGAGGIFAGASSRSAFRGAR